MTKRSDKAPEIGFAHRFPSPNPTRGRRCPQEEATMKNARKVNKQSIMKRGLTLLIALLLAMPGFAFAEAPVDGAPVTDEAAFESDLSGDEDKRPYPRCRRKH